MNDTGQCVPESGATLAYQQAQLIAGKRDVQMFPAGTAELPLPDGFKRHQNRRGVFHFRPDAISAKTIDALGWEGRENEFLNLGPVCKLEIADRIFAGEIPLCVTEYTPDKIEVRSAAGTNKTVDLQMRYFETTQEPGNTVVIGDLLDVIRARLAEMN